ncbi:Purine nucleoside phosphoramidase [Paenibacillus plantiphilus]|uniref:Purine nucleoside phosphoramidase n=1 Tax=Paenibacillus plantiphilus TaxID=2905650 RepID=A0ABN8GNY4_9BACL|nr:histidine triad nucleotide-binding protein [Paenibacillus plantiphilus]CAH1214148.1 Purine nucleoside phosphoramidase [Paenibacillus plantiphilus]
MDCVFCKIIEGSLPSRQVFENERVIAIHDIKPEAPVHILVIPKKHIPTMNDVTDGDNELIAEMFSVARAIAKEQGIAEAGYRLVFNCNKEGGQIVYHLHLHILGGKQLTTHIA